MSPNLRERVDKARRINTFGSIILMILIVTGIWFFQFSSIDLPVWVGIVLLVFFGAGSFVIPSRLDEFCVAKCPSCNAVVETGGLIGQELPIACPKCQSPV